MLRLIFTLFLLLSTIPAFGGPKIAWFSTLQEDLSEKSGFWKRVHDFVSAAAEDLDVDFRIYYAEENFIKLNAQVNEVLSNPKLRPDGIIFHNYKLVGEKILKKAEQHGVKSIVFNAGFANSNGAITPRTEYKHWIGEILPDDEYAGAELLRQLKSAARSRAGKSGMPELQVLAMEGNLSSSAYLARKRGFQRAMAQDRSLKLTQFVPADWSRDIARKQFGILSKRYPNTQIYWAANDNMALGLIDSALKNGFRPGKDFVVGGIDWLPESFDAIRRGDQSVSIGGHFVEGMWALILLYDYLNGHDFEPVAGSSIRTRMVAITRDLLYEHGNVLLKLNSANLQKFDFSELSRSHNEGMDEYPLSISYLLERL